MLNLIGNTMLIPVDYILYVLQVVTLAVSQYPLVVLVVFLLLLCPVRRRLTLVSDTAIVVFLYLCERCYL